MGRSETRLKDPASRLSIGQQQRLCLARELAVEPEILLFDEPTSSLDPASALRIEKAVEDLKSDYTCVIVTHNLNQARRVADHVLFMCDGELVEHGTADAIFDSPQEAQTQACGPSRILRWLWQAIKEASPGVRWRSTR